MNFKKDMVTIMLCVVFFVGMVLFGMNIGNRDGVLFGMGAGILIAITTIVFFSVIQWTLMVNEGGKK